MPGGIRAGGEVHLGVREVNNYKAMGHPPLDQGLLFAETRCTPAPGPLTKAPLLTKLFVCFLRIPVYMLAPGDCSAPWLCLSRPWPVHTFLLCDWLQEQAPQGARIKHHTALNIGLSCVLSALPSLLLVLTESVDVK